MSLNTHPHHFRFALRDEVKVILSGAGFIGHVIGQATSLYAQDSFLVQYKGAQGTPAMEWFHEGQLEHSNIYRSAWGELMKEWLEDGVLRTPQHQEGVNIDAAHQAEVHTEQAPVNRKRWRLPYSRFWIDCKCSASSIGECECVAAHQKAQEGVNIDAAHHAEARAEETAVAQANVATDEPKPMFVGTGTLKIGGVDIQKTHAAFASCNLGHSGASVSLYIPDIEQKPGESLTDFLLRAAAALQGQAATL